MRQFASTKNLLEKWFIGWCESKGFRLLKQIDVGAILDLAAEPPAGVSGLLERAKQQGFVTAAQILQVQPAPEMHIEEVDGVRPLWEAAMMCAGRHLGRDVVESWLREAEPLSLRDGVLTLGAPNGTARDWIDKKYGTSPWGILGGVIIGIVGGLYNLVRESLAAIREAKDDDAKSQ